ncbi:hypothetical protein SOCE26_102070 [Sorangium cellulosum]|uniref:Uncharacterized protein n=1 Tax=Sorangium cellulosum TaxID=56 RepID=A0A2L0FAN3_SORCE|nr:hypothetical protein [Sorangium cellulosum]AUX48666.1 hypothetical protein SOCE26_102070 [Sorangium cellulosum]
MVGAMLVCSALSWVRRGSQRGAGRLLLPALTRRSLRLLGAALALSVGCSGAAPAPPARQAPVVKTPPSRAKAPEGPPLLPAHVVAELEDEDATPYHARRGDEALLLYATGGRWRTRVLGADGAPRGEAIEVGPAPADVPVAALRAAPEGYVAAWIEQVEGSRAVRMLALDAAGKPIAPASLVAHTAEEITWLDVLPNAKGALVLWEMPREDRVDVVMSVVTIGKGAVSKPTGPAAVARGALSWHAVATERGAAVALVLPTAGGAGKAEQRPADKTGAEGAAEAAKLGSVSLLEIDAAGKLSAPVAVSAGPTAQIDLEIAAVGGRYLLTWTDERDIDSAVYLAAVEPGGKVVVAPRQATPPSGEQALVSLVAPAAPGGRALLAWEDLLGARGGERDGGGAEGRGAGRLIHLASVGPDGALSAERAALVFSASGPPDLAADGDGFAAVTLAPAALKAGGGPAVPPVWPTFVRFGPDLSVRAAEPVRAAPFAATDGVPYLVRGLSCHKGVCSTFASAAAGAGPQQGGAGKASGGRAPLALVSLPVRESAWRAPAFREDTDPPPRATGVRALVEGDSIADVAGVDLAGGAGLSAWVTYFVEGSSDGAPRGQDLSATLAVRAVGPGGLGKLNVISQKASSLGGVAIAAAPPTASAGAAAPTAGAGQTESVLAWVARERGETQVYLTKLDATGAKVAQKKLTTAPRKKKPGAAANEATDVAIAYDGAGGFIVAWIDSRDGNAEVYAARVDRALKTTVPDRRITNAPLDAAEVQIVVRGQEAWLVWSDARPAGGGAAGEGAAGAGAPGGGASGEASGDIFLARLDAKTLQRIGDESRLHASPDHSRSPVLAPLEGGFVAGWIEEPTGEGASAGGGARLARIDGSGAASGPATALASPEGAPATSVALACDKVCRGVLVSAPGDSVVLNAFTLAPGDSAAPALKPLAGLTGGASRDVTPALAGGAGGSLFFADDSASGAGRVRWMTITWP